MISIKLQGNFIEITLRHRCSPVNFLHILRTPFTKGHLWVDASEISQCFEINFSDIIRTLSNIYDGNFCENREVATEAVKAILKNFTWRPAILLKRDSKTGVFQWKLRNFSEHLFWRKFASNGCFCNHQRRSIKKGVLKKFAKFTGKHLCQRLFFDEVKKNS